MCVRYVFVIDQKIQFVFVSRMITLHILLVIWMSKNETIFSAAELWCCLGKALTWVNHRMPFSPYWTLPSHFRLDSNWPNKQAFQEVRVGPNLSRQCEKIIFVFCQFLRDTQLAIACLKLTIETLEKSVKYV